jgi:hypothetical protein
MSENTPAVPVTGEAPALPEAIEKLLVQGDLSGLSVDQRVQYYHAVCTSLELNPLTKPFDYIKLNGKLVLYAKKDCTDQLRKIRKVSIVDISSETVGDIYIVRAKAVTGDGRTDMDMGVLSLKNLQGENLANAIMKAMTKAKRRVTLSICGLGFSDETEVDTIPGAVYVPMDAETTQATSMAPPPPAPDKPDILGWLEQQAVRAGFVDLAQACTVLDYPLADVEGTEALQRALNKELKTRIDNNTPPDNPTPAGTPPTATAKPEENAAPTETAPPPVTETKAAPNYSALEQQLVKLARQVFATPGQYDDFCQVLLGCGYKNVPRTQLPLLVGVLGIMADTSAFDALCQEAFEVPYAAITTEQLPALVGLLIIKAKEAGNV